MAAATRCVLRIGVVGFSSSAFDQAAARTKLLRYLPQLAANLPPAEVEIVSGWTNTGVPKIAYEVSDTFGYVTVGLAPQQVKRFKGGLYKVQRQMMVGDRYGDESQYFVDYIDVLLRVGGGPQSRDEVRRFSERITSNGPSQNAQKWLSDHDRAEQQTDGDAVISLNGLLVETEVQWMGK
eukprot:TRINITY_DN14315_c0_g1_i1.p1 TRINITY_DN14315_c0_g1~~TRINITY_DN14315_c0_g1_i1.p1  ORF type:complete len:180 (-),score=39.06 TRINITY_DN14315_c0_g1_i1:76-615(-)